MSIRRSLARAWRARHRSSLRWVLVLALAIAATTRTESIVRDAQRARSGWGRTVLVAIATRDLPAGTVIGADDVTTVERPALIVPDDAEDASVGRTVVHPVAAGEIVLDRRLSHGGTGTTALLGPDDVAFAIPIDTGTPPLHLGDRVDVFAPVDSASRTAVGATRVAHRAVVTSISERAVTVGVDATSATAVARSLLGASVVLALVE